MPCGHYEAGVGVCGETPTRRYLTGQRCTGHTPAALAGRPDLTPDPVLTADGLYRKAFGHEKPAPRFDPIPRPPRRTQRRARR